VPSDWSNRPIAKTSTQLDTPKKIARNARKESLLRRQNGSRNFGKFGEQRADQCAKLAASA
jgi:hypothetical protein